MSLLLGFLVEIRPNRALFKVVSTRWVQEDVLILSTISHLSGLTIPKGSWSTAPFGARPLFHEGVAAQLIHTRN